MMLVSKSSSFFDTLRPVFKMSCSSKRISLENVASLTNDRGTKEIGGSPTEALLRSCGYAYVGKRESHLKCLENHNGY